MRWRSPSKAPSCHPTPAHRLEAWWAQGLAVSYAELGQYEKAGEQLVALTQVTELDVRWEAQLLTPVSMSLGGAGRGGRGGPAPAGRSACRAEAVRGQRAGVPEGAEGGVGGWGVAWKETLRVRW